MTGWMRTDRRSLRTQVVQQVVAARVGDITCAVHIMEAQEILVPRPISAIAGSDPAFLGVVDHRDAVLPVLDLRRKMGLPPADGTLKSKWIVVHCDAERAALVVDRVEGVWTLTDWQQRPLETVAHHAAVSWARSAFAKQGTLLFVLDLRILLLGAAAAASQAEETA